MRASRAASGEWGTAMKSGGYVATSRTGASSPTLHVSAKPGGANPGADLGCGYDAFSGNAVSMDGDAVRDV